MKHCDLLCIGTAIVDLIVRGFQPEPVSATGFVADSTTINVGGEAVNEAIASAKLGTKTRLLCALGEDAAGSLIWEALEKNGVELGAVCRPEGHSTPITTMFVDETGGRKSITTSAHRRSFHPENYREEIENARGITLGSLFRAPFDDPAAIYQVLKTARDADTLIFADTKLPNFTKLSLDDLKDSLPLIDYIFPNEDEARYYSGETEPEAMAEKFLSYGVKNVIVKLGGKGCYYSNGTVSQRLPVFQVKAVDATGAGDQFLAGFAGEILRGSTPLEALRFANACGAICATAVGATTALKNRQQVEVFLAAH